MSSDVFYIWAWQEQTYSVVEMFANHARDDAVLLLFNGASFPETLGAVTHCMTRSAVIKRPSGKAKPPTPSPPPTLPPPQEPPPQN
jgi:hypothetical protein